MRTPVTLIVLGNVVDTEFTSFLEVVTITKYEERVSAMQHVCLVSCCSPCDY